MHTTKRIPQHDPTPTQEATVPCIGDTVHPPICPHAAELATLEQVSGPVERTCEFRHEAGGRSQRLVRVTAQGLFVRWGGLYEIDQKTGHLEASNAAKGWHVSSADLRELVLLFAKEKARDRKSRREEERRARP